MSLFLTDAERDFIKREYTHGTTARLYWGTLNRVNRRAESPGLMTGGDTVEWWHLVAESVCDAAMMHALQPSPTLGTWLRNVTMEIVRRPADDWIGPWFRDRWNKPQEASLETAHISYAVGASIDLCPDLFTAGELDESRAALRERTIPWSLAHLVREDQVHNHWCVVNAGLAIAAAVLDDRAAMDRAAWAYELYCGAFQPDGTYAESLQYANYACFSMMLTYEALVRRDPTYAKRLKPETYAGLATWSAYAHLYSKPLEGWGAQPMPRSINFGDSAAVFVPSAELLLHIAARAGDAKPEDAKLARWLFDTAIDTAPAAPPHDRASFGFVNRPGFLTMPLLAHVGAAASPEALKLPELHALSCGDVIARDAWDGQTTLAQRTGGDDLFVVSHVHGDINTVFLAHNRERLLVDAGHSCYRNAIRELDISSRSHSTCTFEVAGEPREREQRNIANRKRDGAERLAPPLKSPSKRLLAASDGPLRVIASDAAGRYGEPILEFTRLTILCGAHALFVVDRIRASSPVKTKWNWMLNNRDGRGQLKVLPPDRIVFRRGDAGLKIFNSMVPHVHGPQYGFVHDAYHPLPNQLGEGGVGSGILVGWREPVAAVDRTVVHAIACDDGGRIAAWHYKRDGATHELNGRDKWAVTATDASTVEVRGVGQEWRVGADASGTWDLTRV